MKYFLVALFLFLFLRIPSLFEPYWYLDENIYLAIGQGINRGLFLYSQLFDHKPPSLYYLSGFFTSLFQAKLFLFVWMGATTLFFYRLAQKLLSPKSAKISTLLFIILTSIPLLEGNIFNAEIINLLPIVLGFLLYFQKKSIIISALLFGFAFTLKTPSVFDFILFLFLIKPKVIPRALLGFSIPISLWLVYFALNHQLLSFISSAFLSNYNYISSWSSHFFLSQAIIGLFVVFLFRYHRHSSFLLLWFFISLLASTISSRPYPHYLIQVVPAFCLVLGSPKLSNLIFVFLSYLIIILPINFYRYPTLNYYLSFYRSDFTSYFDQNIPSISQASNFISENSNLNDLLYVWGNYPQIYFLSNRLPATKYITTFHVDQFNDYQYLINRLKINQPKFIVVAKATEPFPEFNQFINRYYYLEKNIGPLLIYHQL
ncbi:MAG: hypothetical protein WCV93_00110 [Candidatus Shapirobacteria bacterium]|jgi:hypothetical protein